MFNFENIGEKIQRLAKIIFYISAFITCAVVLFMICFGYSAFGLDGRAIFIFVLVGFIALLFEWIGSWMMFGFGQIVTFCENNESLTYYVYNKDNK